MNRREFIKKASASTALAPFSYAALATPGCTQEKKSAEQLGGRPNIIVVMVDDMGFSDIGSYGGEIDTPNVDNLAEEGLRFTQFHNCARCCPTRASLLTGLYAHQAGLRYNGRSLNRKCVTIAEALKGTGYNTAMAGKWHLSKTPTLKNKADHQRWIDHRYDHEPFSNIQSYPVNRGFDKFYGVIWGVINHFDPFTLVEGTEPVKTVGKNYYFADAITDKAIEYVEEFSGSDQPFFLYYAHCAPHWPLHAKKKDIAKYKGRYDTGWQQLRNDRYKRQLKMGLFDEKNTKLPALMDKGRKWDDISEKEKKFQCRKMEVHAAMVDCIDQNMGRLIDTLKRTGQYDNTLIMFLSDNGSSPEELSGPGYDRHGFSRDGRKVMYDHKAPIEQIGSEITSTGLGPAWASATNTPFKYWKKESYEGGSNTPFIIHWPKGLKTGKGQITRQFGHVMDIMPTCLELAGTDYPAMFEGNTLTAVEGKSLLPILKGKEREGHEEIFFEHENGRAVRMGDWKLVAFSRMPEKWQLFNLADDVTEMNDLSEKYPAKVKEMINAWQNWAKRVGMTKK